MQFYDCGGKVNERLAQGSFKKIYAPFLSPSGRKPLESLKQKHASIPISLAVDYRCNSRRKVKKRNGSCSAMDVGESDSRI
jgi:hypothetical protein